ncbi:MAG: 1,4-dihydroxy-6-naphthoate synthase [Saprospiraceae bacterium]|nr:1,4-dihydroxy-6-naphthoate synthase [Saprospiraceae bacterium]
MKLSLGFSPCPNDTFIFYALLHQKVDTGALQFEPFIADVEELNQKAVHSDLSITKISFNAYLNLTGQYVLLDSGAALGRNCGPLLITKVPMAVLDLAGKTVAIPGEKTTANFLLDTFLPVPVTKKVFLFNEIEQKLLDGEVDAGVIIHENRFTYSERGLHLIQDLGSHWESKTGHPIPLGGIIAQRSIPDDIRRKISTAIRQSINYAWSHPEEVMEFVSQYAQEMEPKVMRQHIALYVNDFSAHLGLEGRAAVTHFFAEGVKQGRIPALPTSPLFA